MARLLHEKLRDAARARGLSVSDVARRMPEVSRASVGHWFNGHRKPLVDHLKRLADILEISAASLVSDDPDYAHNGEERLLLQLARELDATQRQAVLAILKSMHGGNTGKP